VRTVFFGTPELAVPTLQAISRHHEITAIVCQPDRPQGRSKKLLPPPVKVAGEALGIPVHQPAKLNDGTFESWLKKQAPEICTVAAYGRLLKQPLLDVPAKGWLNVHPSLLPRWRGPSPIQTAIWKGDTQTGVSIMRIMLEMDAGDVLLQESVPIDSDVSSPILSDQLAELGAKLMLEGMRQVDENTAQFTPQNAAEVTFSRIITKEDGRIDWSRSGWEIHNQVRALQPWPIAHCLFNGQVFRILKTKLHNVSSDTITKAGEIVEVNKHSFFVATNDALLEILTVQAPGKKIMHSGDFMRGHSIRPGDCFESIIE